MILATGDYVLARRRLWNQMKMTFEELKREMREQEGDPAVKRKAGVNGWALGRPIPEADIVAAEGLALALLAYDDAPKQTSRPETRVRT